MNHYDVVKDGHLEKMSDHFDKYHIGKPGIWSGPGFEIAVERPGVFHHFSAADGPDADYHNHPWPFRSTILVGGYLEEVVIPIWTGIDIAKVARIVGDEFEVKAETVHRIIRLCGQECWTFIEPGEFVQQSGFFRFDGKEARHRYWFEDQWSMLPRED